MTDRSDYASLVVAAERTRPGRNSFADGFKKGLPKMTDINELATVFVPGAAELDDLEDWGPLDEATGPEMRTSGITIWQDGDDEVGIWECTPGPSRWLLQTNELVHVVKGKMTVAIDGGAPVELGVGDTAVFPKGWAGTWDIHETLRKVYAIF